MEKNIDENSTKEFLYNLLNRYDQSRYAINNRATLIIAVNSIFLGVISNALNYDSFLYYKNNLFQIIVLIIIAFCFILSLVYGLLLIIPLSSRKKKNNNGSISYFRHVSEYNYEQYNDKIKALNSTLIINELNKQVYNISRILVIRYDRLKNAGILLGVGIFGTALYLIIAIISQNSC
jgi:hypothetical protein